MNARFRDRDASPLLTVQEQSTTTWSDNTVGSSVKMLSSSPAVSARFTGWSLLAGTGEHLNNAHASTTPTLFTHSQFGGGNFTIYPGSVALTNCLWERVALTIDDDHERERVSPE